MASCHEDTSKNDVLESLSTNISYKEKIQFLLVHSNESSLPDATRQVSRTIGCTKSTLDRVLSGEMYPTPLMQNEIDNVFRASLKNKSLKSLDKTLNFWQRNVAFWHTPDTTDLYSGTINPLYEEIP